jgi:hypothetical protein
VDLNVYVTVQGTHRDVGICMRVHVQLPACDCDLAQWMAMEMAMAL